MSRQTFRANLSASQFPLLSGSYGRSVVLAQQDQNYIRPNAFSGLESDKNIGIPQIIYCENVMPTATGFQSIGFTNPIPAGPASDFDQAFYLRDSGENRTLFVPGAGKCYTYNTTTNHWDFLALTVPVGAICSVATLKGRTFVCFSNHTNFLEWIAGVLTGIALTGLNPLNVRGLTTAKSYLIAWDYDTIYWSSTLTPDDFTPSLSTGAGSEKVLGLKGRIVYCKAIEDGFIIYTTAHAIVAKYSNNIRFPWVYNELKGSSGIGFPDDVCDAPDGTLTYAYGNDGLVAFDRVKSDTVFPEVTEFIAGGQYEVYNRATKNLDITSYTARLNTKISYVGSRWLVLSFGVTANMTHALVYDTALKRWGKITIDHVDCFEYFGDTGSSTVTGAVSWAQVVGSWGAQVNPWNAWGTVQSGGLSSSTTPYKVLAFLSKDGQVHVVDFNVNNLSDNSVLYLGKFQFIRARLTTILDIDAEGLDPTNCDVEILTSFDGLNIDKTTVPKIIINRGGLKRWQYRVTGINHVLRFTGNFQMNTVVLRTMLNGER